ncbi:hypothetical protein SAMN05443634_101266 [Chishuiella changwenlii]|jgi:hypothetical protein|uniref:Uncharacterized protein n=2 Tax=Chishuiella changwenlii TaxID=1434701 RepID=A0A1M6T5T4_9FLAO|nr:hypothetical protein [Chishuiella changwenlii]GGE94902.1 hypothetical protein GCM10010984_10580 [Chishuiella changwenlii]SHK52098.1 hypothetical protein SAMN05443634_101266 [Chishuiella changwenlii]
MKSIWEATLEDNVIRIENNWFAGEKLFVNEKLQDFQVNYFSSPILTGHLKNSEGNKLRIKANIIQEFFGLNCVLFIDDEQIPLKKVK